MLQEMMYVWNGFTIVGKRADLTENLLVTVEKAETALQNDKSKFECVNKHFIKLQKWSRFTYSNICIIPVNLLHDFVFNLQKKGSDVF